MTPTAKAPPEVLVLLKEDWKYVFMSYGQRLISAGNFRFQWGSLFLSLKSQHVGNNCSSSRTVKED